MIGYLVSLFYRKPDFIIGGAGNPYMLRWWLFPRNRWFNVYLHKIVRDDDDRALHDHPWHFLSIVLRGGYIEHRDKGRVIKRHAPSIALRRATDQHRIELRRHERSGAVIPAWTICILSPRVREWGFWCPQGFVHWKDFVAASDTGNIGRGCGETT